MFIVSLLSLQNVCYYDSVYVLSFRSRINPDQWYHSNLLFDCFSAHVPTRFEYREFGLELVSLDHSRHPKKTPTVEEKREDGAGHPIKPLLEESLNRHRNEMMDSFAQILR